MINTKELGFISRSKTAARDVTTLKRQNDQWRLMFSLDDYNGIKESFGRTVGVWASDDHETIVIGKGDSRLVFACHAISLHGFGCDMARERGGRMKHAYFTSEWDYDEHGEKVLVLKLAGVE